MSYNEEMKIGTLKTKGKMMAHTIELREEKKNNSNKKSKNGKYKYVYKNKKK